MQQQLLNREEAQQQNDSLSLEARIEAEWVVVNAFRGLTKIATNGDMTKSTYDNAIELGGELYPQLLGIGTSLLRRQRESETTKEYRQRARIMSTESNAPVHALSLVEQELRSLKALLSFSERNGESKASVDQLRRKLKQLDFARSELDETKHSEHQLIFRDAYSVERNVPNIATGQGYRDFDLGEGRALRLRVLHPDKPEHITGADIIYERHHPTEEAASIIAVQYKIWEDRKIYLTDERAENQIKKMGEFLCSRGYCGPVDVQTYRFPHCAAFLRPTDRLQNANQKFISTGEHLPIYQIDSCISRSERKSPILEYKGIKKSSLSGDLFEYLFNRDKIGSRLIPYNELQDLYEQHAILNASESVVIYAQEL